MKWGAVIGGIALAAVAALPARAADLTLPRGIPATSGYIPAQFFWTGFYLGAGIGGAFGTSTFTDPFSGATASPSLKGFLVSGVMGVNYQINAVVIGVESDFTGTFAKGSATVAVPPAPVTFDTLTTDVFWTGSVTGRVGWAFDRLLVYGKGGVGFSYDRDTVDQSRSGGSAIGSTYRAGWTVGGGVEYALTEHWTGRLEYDYFKFPSKGFTFQGNTIPTIGGGLVGFNLNEIKAIMAYKF
jgi:outer membrane immunogenic protein